MDKLIRSALLVLLAMTGWGSAAFAQVPGGGGEAVCQLIIGGLVADQTGGTFPVGPAHCEFGGEAVADIAIQPFVSLSAAVNTIGVDPADRSGVTAVVALQYDFTLTGGNFGDLVPVLIHTSMSTDVGTSVDPNNANSASANIVVFGVSSVGGGIVSNGPSTFACSVSPVDCDGDEETVDDLEFNMFTGTAGRVFLQVLVAASSTSEGSASARIDPFIFVDPRFPNAAAYTISVADGVANALPVPEPSVLALLLAGLGGLSASAWRRRSEPLNRHTW